jgi:hypothetical protein
LSFTEFGDLVDVDDEAWPLAAVMQVRQQSLAAGQYGNATAPSSIAAAPAVVVTAR